MLRNVAWSAGGKMTGAAGRAMNEKKGVMPKPLVLGLSCQTSSFDATFPARCVRR